MKTFSLLLLVVSPLFIAVNARSNIRDAPSTTVDIQDGQTGVLMVVPPRPTETGTKRIPDADHPFIAPGPNDMRGPCPDMNTLANHGYISRKYGVFFCFNCMLLILPRSGITSFEEIIIGAAEAFNIDRDMGVGMASLNLLARGNAFVNKISIGGVSPLVPPLPGQIDGPETRGNSSTRTGRSCILSSEDSLDEDLEILAKFGADGPDGPATVFNLETLIELKRQNLESDQLLDPERTGFARRLQFWVDPSQAKLRQHCPSGYLAHNDENGVFVADPPAPAPFNISSGCAAHWDNLANAVPGSLANVTGIFKQNVDMLTGCSEPVAPAGPTNV
ncbi:hypothetical protein B0H14DRAFT_2585180 [Mycena olivaceomarginata]|nr:hypothetical protein B0H14DRAFT_2585180 [Mycena olivaceomarginata]